MPVCSCCGRQQPTAEVRRTKGRHVCLDRRSCDTRMDERAAVSAPEPERERTCAVCGRRGPPELVSPETLRCVRPCYARMKIGGHGGYHTRSAAGRRRLAQM